MRRLRRGIRRLCHELVEAGTFERLSDAKRPNSYLARSDPDDVARVEDRTFICSEHEDDAGPTNNWRDPDEMRELLSELFQGSMRGTDDVRGPVLDGAARLAASPRSASSSPTRAYVAVSMRIMTRMGKGALEALGDEASVRALPALRRRCR